MPRRKSNRTARTLLKIAALGVAGLLAGLFTACSASNPFRVGPPSQAAVWQLNPASLPPAHHLRTLKSRPLPSLKHPPVSHRIVNPSQIDPTPTLTSYAFEDSHSTPNPDSRH